MWWLRLKGSFYTLFFVMLNLVYLVIELSFNARVLDVSAAMSPDMDYGQLEIYGRTISATGATILAWRLLVPFRASLNLYRLVIKFFIIAVIVFPLVFIGQKKLIDDLVEFSSAETRRSAEILSLLKYGIANGFVEIDELAVDELTLQTAEGKMFIMLSGLLAYNSNDMRQVLENKLDRIAGYAITTQQSDDTQQLYKNYLYARDQVLDRFQGYGSLVNELERNQAGSMTEAVRLYEKAMNRAMLQWLEYQQSLKEAGDIDQVPQVQVSMISNTFEATMVKINGCSNNSCFNEGVERLEFQLSRLLGYYTELRDWCRELADAERGRILQCLSQPDEIRRNIINTRKMTLAVHAGLSRPYASKLEYLKSKDLRATIFANLKESGIRPNSEWNFTQYESMLADISDQLEAIYRAHYDAAIREQFSAEIQPRTSIEAFNRIDSLQIYYRQALGEDIALPVEIDLDRQQFENEYVAARYFSKFTQLLSKLRAGEEWYQNDAPYEQSGKTSLRNLVIPPVVIAFSLIFGLLNMINLLLNFVFLMVRETLWLRWLGSAVMTVFILLLPMRQQYQIYSQPAYQDLMMETEKSYGYWVYALKWVAETEPLVYPLGNALRYNLLDGFEFN